MYFLVACFFYSVISLLDGISLYTCIVACPLSWWWIFGGFQFGLFMDHVLQILLCASCYAPWGRVPREERCIPQGDVRLWKGPGHGRFSGDRFTNRQFLFILYIFLEPVVLGFFCPLTFNSPFPTVQKKSIPLTHPNSYSGELEYKKAPG